MLGGTVSCGRLRAHRQSLVERIQHLAFVIQNQARQQNGPAWELQLYSQDGATWDPSLTDVISTSPFCERVNEV